MKNKLFTSGLALAAIAVVLGGASAYAALSDSTNFSQEVTNGTLSTFIGDTNGDEVAAPSVAFPSTEVSNATQTSDGTFGTNGERIYVDNPGGANNGWTLALAATGGASAAWNSGTNNYAFNGATADDGQLTVDPSTGALTAEVGTTTGMSLGTPATFSAGGNTPVNLLTAAAASDDIARVYLTGVKTSQTIPAATPAGTYTIDFTQTVTAS